MSARAKKRAAPERYRLLRQVGNDVNADGTPGAPLLAGWVGTVKRRDVDLVVLDFAVEAGPPNALGMVQVLRSVSFPASDLHDPDMFELVKEG
jgi:hypothetical protein